MKHRFAFVLELAALLLFLFLFYGRQQYVIEPTAVPIRNVVVALGLVYHHAYPCHSETAHQLLANSLVADPGKTLNADLRALLPVDLISSEPGEHWGFNGTDIGQPYAIYGLWKLTGIYTVGIVITAFKAVHILGVISLFFLCALTGIPGFGLFGALIFAFSPVVLQEVFNFSPYLLVPIFCVAISLVIALARPNSKLRFSWRIALAMLGGGGIATAIFFRPEVIIILLPVTLLLTWSIRKSGRHQEWLILFAVIAAFLLFRSLGAAAFWPHGETYSTSVGVEEIYKGTLKKIDMPRRHSHVFWHQMYQAMGEFDNPFGFAWADAGPFTFVVKQNPSVSFASDEYSRILRNHIIKTGFHHPQWVIGNWIKKLGNVSRQWLELFPGLGRQWQVLSILLFLISVIGGWFVVWDGGREIEYYVIAPFYTFFCVPIMMFSQLSKYILTSYVALALSLYLAVYKITAQLISWRANKVQP